MTAQAAGAQTPQAPWSVKGIAPHTREAVKEAARRSGMTIGEWLSSAITRQAEAEPPPARAASADERWAEVAAHLARLVRRDAEAAPSPPPREAVSVHAIARWLREAEARAVRREQVRAARLAEALTGLARYIDNAERARADEARRAALEHAEATRELSHTLARIARRMKRMDDRLADLPREAAALARETAGQAAAAQAELLASRLLPAMEQRLAAGLREIVESLSPPGEALQPPAPDAEQLAVEDRLARAIVDIRTRQVELARLEAADDDEGQQAIIERLEALSRKLDSALRPGGDDAPLAALDTVLERLDSISSRLDDNRPPPALSRVEDMVRSLSENVEALHRDSARADAPAGDAALDTLAAQISQLAQRLEDLARHDAASDPGTAPEDRSRLQNLETAIGALSLQLRDLPRADEAALERMARAAAREALGALSPDDALPRARSEDTLDAVHSTLERIVDRLALIEEDIRASGVGLQQPADASADGSPENRPLPPGALSLPEIRAAQALSRAFPSPTPDAPEPAVDGPEDLLARDSGGLTENVGFTASFIAAARRAAMAAADETRQKPPASPASEASPDDATARRRSLLIGLGALIAATGAAQVAATLMQGAVRLS